MNEVEFEWDEFKAAKVLEKHGIDLRDMVELFSKPMLRHRSKNTDEERFIAHGEKAGRVYTIIYTIRGDVIRLITAHRASRRDRRAYYESYPQDSRKGQD